LKEKLDEFSHSKYNSIERYNTIQYNTIWFFGLTCGFWLTFSPFYDTIQYHTIQYNTIQYNTIQYNRINLVAESANIVAALHPSHKPFGRIE